MRICQLVNEVEVVALKVMFGGLKVMFGGPKVMFGGPGFGVDAVKLTR